MVKQTLKKNKKQMLISTEFAYGISLYEFYLNTLLLMMAISFENWFLLLFLACLFTKHIPEQIFKHASSALNLSIGKRPPEAKNCNSLNAGGIATSSGIISGHVFNLTSLIFYLIYDANGHFTLKRLTLISVLSCFDIILGYSRIIVKCHTQFQVMFGYCFGIIWGYVIYSIIQYVESKYDRVKVDHQIFADLVNK